jgi:hypothetical protein
MYLRNLNMNLFGLRKGSGETILVHVEVAGNLKLATAKIWPIKSF